MYYSKLQDVISTWFEIRSSVKNSVLQGTEQE